MILAAAPMLLQGPALVDRVMPVFSKFMGKNDTAVINFGLHHGKGDYAELVQNFTSYVEAHRQELPTIFWQQTPPQHFDTKWGTGDFGGGKPPFKCAAIPNVQLVVSEKKLLIIFERIDYSWQLESIEGGEYRGKRNRL